MSLVSSFLLLALVPVSFFIWVAGHRSWTQSNIVFFINNGCISAIYQRGPGMVDFLKRTPDGTNSSSMQVFRGDQSRTYLYLAQNVRRAILPEWRDFSDYPPPNPANVIRKDGFYLPILNLACLCAIPWAWMLIPRLRAPLPGHCPRCGYDLRATPERCPECGN